MKLPANPSAKSPSADARASSAAGRTAARPAPGAAGDPHDHIGADVDDLGTGSGAGAGAGSEAPRKNLGGDRTVSAGTALPLGDRAHIVNKDAHAQKLLAGPGSLDPDSLAPPTISDVRRWLAKRGVELHVPEAWRFMGTSLEGRAISFNHTATHDGHSVELTTWRLADDTPLDKFLAPYLEEAVELTRLGRLGAHKALKIGDAEGVLLVGFGPDSKDELLAANQEALFLATDGTGRRTMSWRGAVERHGESHLVIASFSSPIESFFEARPVFDAMLDRLRVVR